MNRIPKRAVAFVSFSKVGRRPVEHNPGTLAARDRQDLPD